MLPLVRASSRRVDAAAFAIYCAVSFAYFGSWVASHPGRRLVGRSTDTNVFIWNFAWWPHALLHGENPIYTHAIWAPSGLDLAWAVSSPGLSLAFAPLTLLFGPLVSYNVAAVLMPALAAWTAFLLCRYVTKSFWPSLAGGYLFGFSSWMLGQQADAHLHMVGSFLVPVLALVMLQFLDGCIGRRGSTLRLGLLLAAQFAVSTELFATMTVACVVSLTVAFALIPSLRGRLRAAVAPILGAYALASCLVSPLLYYVLTDFRSTVFFPPADYSADLLNFVLPTQDSAIGGSAAKTISAHFTSNAFEQGAYLGLPALAILVLFVLRRWRLAGGRFLGASLVIATLASLGTALWVEGHRLVPLPWRFVAQLPALDKVFPVRLLVYVTLLVAVTVALWAASNDAPRWLRVALPALAVLALVPHVQAHRWDRTPRMPAFFASGAYNLCLESGENDLIIPYNFLGEALLWQAKSGFHFRMADGDFGSGFIPPEFAGTTVLRLLHDHGHPGDGPSILELAHSKGVSTILLDPSDPWPWQPILGEIEPPRKTVGGMLLYPLEPGLVTDFACIPD
jgi:hypothetical protein